MAVPRPPLRLTAGLFGRSIPFSFMTTVTATRAFVLSKVAVRLSLLVLLLLGILPGGLVI